MKLTGVKFFLQAQFAMYRVLTLQGTTPRCFSRGWWTVFQLFLVLEKSLGAWVDGIFWTFFKQLIFLCQMYGNRNGERWTVRRR